MLISVVNHGLLGRSAQKQDRPFCSRSDENSDEKCTKSGDESKRTACNKFSALLAVSCLLAMLLIGCVEPNPGPLTPTKHTGEPREHHSDTSSSMHKEASGLPNGASSVQSDTDASDLLQYFFILRYTVHDQRHSKTGGGAATTDQCYDTAVRQYPAQP